MSFVSILESIFIGPLKLIFEIIFVLANMFLNNPGFSIIALSLVMNILVLPLYKRADAMQEESRITEQKLHRGVSHIKKVFSSDEKMMILQTYYRQNNYKPTDVLKGSVSLLLEIPFFMAAYQFLSHLETIKGVSLGPIKDLGAPDELIVIGGITLNLLPILMTLINVISSAIYLKGFPLKTKIQLYGMAGFFLVFLYTSPSGLVFYWTLNNVFSLVKTIFYKLKNPKKVLTILMAMLGILFFGIGIFMLKGHIMRQLLVYILGIILEIPTAVTVIKRKFKCTSKVNNYVPNGKLFFVSSLFMALLIGVLIPSAFISASPQEYLAVTTKISPMWYIINSLCLSVGTFLVWMRVFYWLANKKGKVIFERVICIICGVAIINYMFFGTNLGNMSPALKYDNEMVFSANEQISNIAVILVAVVAIYFIAKKFSKALTAIFLIAAIAVGSMSGINMASIKSSLDSVPQEVLLKTPQFTLSKTGKNVIVISLDRAMGTYIPYIMNEFPEIREQFDGFTHYSNTISFGGHTNFGAPPMLGGYEYTPVEMNKRADEKLSKKHNEALLVLPTLFSQHGYEVTVCDSPYTNYEWYTDTTLFENIPNTKAYRTEGYFADEDIRDSFIAGNMRNFFCFSAMKSLPVFAQPYLYSDGSYLMSAAEESSVPTGSTQVVTGLSTASGYNVNFMNSYAAIDNMDTMTKVTSENKNTFLVLNNNMTHEPMMLQCPNYEISPVVDNTEFDAENSDRFILDGKELRVTGTTTMMHYQINTLALKKLGEWFDYLRENDVYDNTKIIITSDHAFPMKNFEDLVHSQTNDHKDISLYVPMLLVKDFDSHGYSTSEEFMTNADVPTLATDGVIDNPVNPFTNKPINSDEKTAHPQFVSTSYKFDVSENNGTTFLPGMWAQIDGGNLWDKNSWTFYDKNIVLDTHSFPAE